MRKLEDYIAWTSRKVSELLQVTILFAGLAGGFWAALDALKHPTLAQVPTADWLWIVAAVVLEVQARKGAFS